MDKILKDKLKELTDSIAALRESVGKIGNEPDPIEITISEGASMADENKVVEEAKAEEVVVAVEVPEVVEAPIVVTDPAVAEVVAPVVETPAEVVVEIPAEAAKNEDVKTEEQESKNEAVADEAIAAKKLKQEGLKKAMCSEDLEGLELSETEAALASQFSYVDLVKLAAGLSLEVASFRTAKAEAEAVRVVTERVATLAEAGVLFAGDEGLAQKEEIKALSEEAFASYVDKTKKLKDIFEAGAGLDKDAVKAAKSSLEKLAVAPVLEQPKKDYRLL